MLLFIQFFCLVPSIDLCRAGRKTGVHGVYLAEKEMKPFISKPFPLLRAPPNFQIFRFTDL
jgi:hypothetical protein